MIRKIKTNLFTIRYRWLIIGVTILAVLISALWLFKLKINSDLESYMPEDMPARQQSKIINEVFGYEEPLLIVIENEDVLEENTLSRIERIADDFANDSRFSNVFSLFHAKNIRSEDGVMIVDPVISRIPQTENERDSLKNEIRSNKLVYGLVVSEDFKNALIILSSNKTAKDAELMSFVNQVLENNPGPEEVYVTGQPYLRDDAEKKIAQDLFVILPIGLILMFLMLWFSFKELKAVLLPFSVVVFSIIVCIGLIPLFGWELGLIGVLIPIMMIAIANNYGVYFIARYQDLNANQPHLSMYKIVDHSVKYLTKPVLFCGLTTIVGVLGLVTHILLPAQQMGVVTSIGIGFALIVSLFFIPSVMSFMKKGKPFKKENGESKDFFLPLTKGVGNLVTKHPKWVFGIFITLFIICTSGLFYFKVAPDWNGVMPDDHPFNKGVQVVDKDFGGSKMLNVMFEGDVKEPKLMNKLIECEEGLKELPNVGSVASLATIVKEISKALNDSNSVYFDQIPDNREAIAQYLELYTMSSDPEDVERFVDFDYTKTLMTVQFTAKSISDVEDVIKKLDEITGEDAEFDYVAGGYPLVEIAMSQSILTGQYYSLLFAFVAIIILLSIIFRSLVAGLIGSVPLAFAVFCTFGLMGWLGMELNIVTALLSSISIGLGVDFTIHVFWRIKWELAAGNNYVDSIKNTLTTIGRGITINAFSVMVGFAVAFTSAFPIIHSFAFLIIISLFLCLICALVFIPAFALILKPKFLERK